MFTASVPANSISKYLSPCILVAMVLLLSFIIGDDKIYNCNNGLVTFVSDAPLETIKASSEELRGAVDATNRTFLFTLDVNSFHGFNSGLQREHFNENYLETSLYPKVTFKGKFVEEINFSENGNYEIRAKGMLDLHGVKQERILKGTISIRNDVVTIDSRFTVLLEDHAIRIPRVVYQKISPEIVVSIHAEMKPTTGK
ncbi:MAG: YceI family protein [Chitinophagaceae bacterium]|nr:YceI family protein [Chitinophagaceae bacterium]